MDQTDTLFNGRYLRIRRRGHWEYAERTNASAAVIIVAVTPEDRLLLVEQFRIPVNARSIEMPAGLVGDIADGESVEAAALRELEEETGWRAGRIDYLMAGPSSSGMSNERVAFVRALDLVRVGPGGGDETEDIRVHEIPRADAAAWLSARMREGYSIDPKLYAGLWFLDRNPDGSPARRTP
ncbi:MAG: NUDIX hydrolase [Chiayiivirga sp.]|jgi:ADP-ribose pyrophosphatase|uniref:GDP-mannose pyrophosphatase n=1 Tax=Denitratimonas tolerans TaxID=1338420 RepID=A0AAW9QU94_9GAMM|nr:NUDIX hydrolase [Chiayiivirga sp.]HRO88420.1 NUDIX hydrolase [Chiayiivirga sp.]HRQ34389.1 NUDIX hydrolase [Chiayiivirga sp.]